MPRPRKGLPVPHCDKHPKHLVWLDGTYGKPPAVRRRDKCVAPDGSTHVFVERLPRRVSTTDGAADELSAATLTGEIAVS